MIRKYCVPSSVSNFVLYGRNYTLRYLVPYTMSMPRYILLLMSDAGVTLQFSNLSKISESLIQAGKYIKETTCNCLISHSFPFIISPSSKSSYASVFVSVISYSLPCSHCQNLPSSNLFIHCFNNVHSPRISQFCQIHNQRSLFGINLLSIPLSISPPAMSLPRNPLTIETKILPRQQGAAGKCINLILNSKTQVSVFRQNKNKIPMSLSHQLLHYKLPCYFLLAPQCPQGGMAASKSSKTGLF